MSASASTPEITIVTPEGGENFIDDNVDLEWTGSDADGDTVVYSVFYSPDDGITWKLIASELTSSRLSIPRRSLEASNAARFQVQGSDGLNIGAAISNTFSVANNAPNVTIESPQLNQSFSGLQNIPLRAVAVDTEDGQLNGPALSWSSDLDGSLGIGNDLSINAADLTEATHEIAVTATDSDGAFSTDVVRIRIFRIAPVDLLGPTTSDVVANPNPAAIGTNVVVSANVDDSQSGDANIASAAYSIDGGLREPMSAADGVFDSSMETVVADVAGLTVGVHEICVYGTDEFGNTGQPDCAVLVVYDPEGGFVSGGGWIDSEPGWCQLDDLCAGAEGKANFGFVSKYKKGATVPTGQTEFNFVAGGLNFHSDSYDWLVVNQSGTNAQYKGAGTINGESAPSGGLYRFMLWANDLSPSEDDTFRIKIWYEDEVGTEVVVYDNGFDQPIGGGSIIVHTGKGSKGK